VKIQIVSDTHFEFQQDKGKEFLKELSKESEVDLLVIAGDFTNCSNLQVSIKRACKLFKHVVFVLGNHEYYGSSKNITEKTMSGLDKIQNFTWLNNSSFRYMDHVIHGSTLWFKDFKDSYIHRKKMNDFRKIANFEDWVFEENAKSVRYLRKSVSSKDIIVTHYLPSYRSIHPKYAGSVLTPMFLTDVEDIIVEKQPSLWIHGHTHESLDYMIEKTRVVCNPFGYAMLNEVNPSFKDNKIIEL
jgi:Icc-related predicted phosphoesterase